MIADERTVFLTREGEPYVPVNYDHTYHGPVLARQALACSYNLPAVKVLEEVGVHQLGALARDLGITTFADLDRFGLALTLGGGEVRLLELTAAYAAFANGGRRVAPVAILRVEDEQGRVLYRGMAGPSPSILDPRVAYLVTDILSDEWARAPAFGEGSALRLSRPAAAKTGTTTDWRDNWTIGYTPGLVTGVWAGNADNTPMYQVSGVTGAAPMWHDFMERALVGRHVRGFREPEGLIRATVCAKSGQRLSPDCPFGREELFIVGTEPSQLCDTHRPVAAWTAGSESRTASRRDSDNWGRLQGQSAFADGSGALMRNDSPSSLLALVSPDPNSVFRLVPGRSAQSQKIALVAEVGSRAEIQRVSLNVDGQSIAVLTSPPFRALWTMERGEHVITATGRGTEDEIMSSDPVRIAVE
jgi:membrane carboxypeptidase/penicillin-binding protein